jgi:hypothetical protein
LENVTEKVIQYINEYHYFPNEIQILKAEILTDDWGSRFLYIEYLMYNDIHNITKYYVYSLEDAIISTVEKIKDYYIKLHTITI